MVVVAALGVEAADVLEAAVTAAAAMRFLLRPRVTRLLPLLPGASSSSSELCKTSYFITKTGTILEICDWLEDELNYRLTLTRLVPTVDCIGSWTSHTAAESRVLEIATKKSVVSRLCIHGSDRVTAKLANGVKLGAATKTGLRCGRGRFGGFPPPPRAGYQEYFSEVFMVF